VASGAGGGVAIGTATSPPQAVSIRVTAISVIIVSVNVVRLFIFAP